MNSTQTNSKFQITIENDYLHKLQRRFAFATVSIPFIGTVVAALLLRSGISAIEVGLLVGMYTLTMLGIELGFHRLFSHHAFSTNTPVRVMFAILGSMAAQGPVIQWVTNHRNHHQYSDQPGDIHSPHLYQEKSFGWFHGLWYSHIGWMFDSDLRNSALYAKDLLRDSTMTKVNRLYLSWVILGLAIPAVLSGVLTWTWIGALKGFLWGGLVRVFLVHHATWSLNSIGHLYGQRPFKTDDCSTNNIWLALPTLGGSWHNNHHAFPNSAINGLEWWQIDLCGWVVYAMEKMGLVWNVKKPKVLMMESKKDD